MSSAAQRAVQC